MSRVSIAVVDPDRERCRTVAGLLAGPKTGAVREVPGYFPSLQDAPWLANQGFDMIFVALDSDPRDAFLTAESLSALGQSTIVIYSQSAGQESLLRAMRSGARDFFTFPFPPGEAEQAIERAAARKRVAPAPRRNAAKVFVFIGAKGGAGVTTVACNFAVDLAHDTKQDALLIDFDLPLGDAAIDLGLDSEFSTFDALHDADRLDGEFLSRLLVKHSSGLSLLASPGRFPYVPAENAAVDRLLTVACNNFNYVVVDAGSRLDSTRTRLFDFASRIYLVTQVGIPELRNANRMISSSILAHGPKLEIVLNRFEPGAAAFDDGAIQQALTRAPDWRIPSDYLALRDTRDRAESLALDDSPIARVIHKMARGACGLPEDTKKKRLFGLFG
jgi:pilus assembly protein CpaE